MLSAAAIEDVEMLVGHGVGVINAGSLLHARETPLEILLPPMHHNDAFDGVVSRSPEEIILMPADGWRQAVFRTEQIDRAGLAVILPENRGPGANVRWQAVVNARDRGSHLLPSELVGIDLRQRAQLVSFDGRGLEMQRLRISDVRFRRQNRNDEWREHGARRKHQGRIGKLETA